MSEFVYKRYGSANKSADIDAVSKSDRSLSDSDAPPEDSDCSLSVDDLNKIKAELDELLFEVDGVVIDSELSELTLEVGDGRSEQSEPVWAPDKPSLVAETKEVGGEHRTSDFNQLKKPRTDRSSIVAKLNELVTEVKAENATIKLEPELAASDAIEELEKMLSDVGSEYDLHGSSDLGNSDTALEFNTTRSSSIRDSMGSGLQRELEAGKMVNSIGLNSVRQSELSDDFNAEKSVNNMNDGHRRKRSTEKSLWSERDRKRDRRHRQTPSPELTFPKAEVEDASEIDSWKTPEEDFPLPPWMCTVEEGSVKDESSYRTSEEFHPNNKQEENVALPSSSPSSEIPFWLEVGEDITFNDELSVLPPSECPSVDWAVDRKNGSEQLPACEKSFILRQPAGEPCVIPKQLPACEKNIISEQMPVCEKSVISKQLPASEKSLVSKQLPVGEKSLVSEQLSVCERNLISKQLPAGEKSFVSEQWPAGERNLISEQLQAGEKNVIAQHLSAGEINVVVELSSGDELEEEEMSSTEEMSPPKRSRPWFLKHECALENGVFPSDQSRQTFSKHVSSSEKDHHSHNQSVPENKFDSNSHSYAMATNSLSPENIMRFCRKIKSNGASRFLKPRASDEHSTEPMEAKTHSSSKVSRYVSSSSLTSETLTSHKRSAVEDICSRPTKMYRLPDVKPTRSSVFTKRRNHSDESPPVRSTKCTHTNDGPRSKTTTTSKRHSGDKLFSKKSFASKMYKSSAKTTTSTETTHFGERLPASKIIKVSAKKTTSTETIHTGERPPANTSMDTIHTGEKPSATADIDEDDDKIYEVLGMSKDLLKDIESAGAVSHWWNTTELDDIRTEWKLKQSYFESMPPVAAATTTATTTTTAAATTTAIADTVTCKSISIQRYIASTILRKFEVAKMRNAAVRKYTAAICKNAGVRTFKREKRSVAALQCYLNRFLWSGSLGYVRSDTELQSIRGFIRSTANGILNQAEFQSNWLPKSVLDHPKAKDFPFEFISEDDLTSRSLRLPSANDYLAMIERSLAKSQTSFAKECSNELSSTMTPTVESQSKTSPAENKNQGSSQSGDHTFAFEESNSTEISSKCCHSRHSEIHCRVNPSSAGTEASQSQSVTNIPSPEAILAHNTMPEVSIVPEVVILSESKTTNATTHLALNHASVGNQASKWLTAVPFPHLLTVPPHNLNGIAQPHVGMNRQAQPVINYSSVSASQVCQLTTHSPCHRSWYNQHPVKHGQCHQPANPPVLSLSYPPSGYPTISNFSNLPLPVNPPFPNLSNQPLPVHLTLPILSNPPLPVHLPFPNLSNPSLPPGYPPLPNVSNSPISLSDPLLSSLFHQKISSLNSNVKPSTPTPVGVNSSNTQLSPSFIHKTTNDNVSSQVPCCPPIMKCAAHVPEKSETSQSCLQDTVHLPGREFEISLGATATENVENGAEDSSNSLSTKCELAFHNSEVIKSTCGEDDKDASEFADLPSKDTRIDFPTNCEFLDIIDNYKNELVNVNTASMQGSLVKMKTFLENTIRQLKQEHTGLIIQRKCGCQKVAAFE